MLTSTRLDKRAFTILELVIVVAVVAVLAAVLIPTFSSVVEKAYMSSDLQMIRNAFTIIESEKAFGKKISTVDDARALLASNGISALELNSIGYQLYWDAEICNFVLYDPSCCLSVYPDGMDVEDCELIDGADVGDSIEPPAQIENDNNDGDDAQQPSDNEQNDNSAVVTPKYNLTTELSSVSVSTETCAGEENKHWIILKATDGKNAIGVRITKNGETLYEEAIANTEIKYKIDNEPMNVHIEAYGLYNALPFAKSKRNGLDYSNGYVDGYKLEEASIQSAEPGFTTTGWIEIPWDSVANDKVNIYIYIKDGEISMDAKNSQKGSPVNSNGSYRQYLYFDVQATASLKDVKNYSKLITENYMTLMIDKNDYNILEFKYLRISVKGSGANLIITFDQPILPIS